MRSVVALGPRWTGRFELHLVDRNKTADRTVHERYERREVMPAGFAVWQASERQAIEVAYMLSSYEWTEQYTPGAPADTREGTTEKVSIAWIFTPSPAFSLKLFVSHQLSITEFGGGNVQLRGTF
jgi:hypothetical protein